MYQKEKFSIRSLRAFCNVFGIILAQFFAEGEMVELTPEQKTSLTR